MKGIDMTVRKVWSLLDEGKAVYWTNTLYKVYIEDVNTGHQNQREHFTRRGNKLLSVRCTDNGFGSIMTPSDLPKLFLNEEN